MIDIGEFLALVAATRLSAGELQVTGGNSIGSDVKATYRKGSGTVQFTRTPNSGGASIDLGEPVPSGSTYKIKITDRGFTIGAKPVTYLPGAAHGISIPSVGEKLDYYMVASNRFAVPTDWGITTNTLSDGAGDTTGVNGGSGAVAYRFSRARFKFTLAWDAEDGRFLWTNRSNGVSGMINGKFNFTIQRVEVKNAAGDLLDVVKWSGSSTHVMQLTEDIWNDSMAYLPAGTYYLDLWYDLPPGAACPSYTSALLKDESKGESLNTDLSLSPMGPADAMSSSPGGKFGPVMFVAKGCPVATPVGVVFGDSIDDYTAVSAPLAPPRGDIGFIKQALGSAQNGGPWNYVSMSRYSSNSQAVYNTNANPTGVAGWLDACMKLLQSQPMFNFIIDEHMRNDCGPTDTLVTIQNKKNALWNRLAALWPTVPIFKTTPPAYSSAANFSGWTNEADQSVSASASSKSVMDSAIAWVLAGGGGKLAGVFDTGAAVQGSSTEKWKVPPFTASLLAATSTNTSNIVTLSAAPSLGETLVIEPGNATNFDIGSGSRLYTAISVKPNATLGGFDVELAGARNVPAVPGTSSWGSRVLKAHAIGAAVASTLTTDGLHPAQSGHNLMSAPIVAGKPSIAAAVALLYS